MKREQLLLFLLVVTVGMLLSGCGQEEAAQPKRPPVVASGPGADYIEVSSGQKPPSPYWLGPPKAGAYLYAKKPIPGSGALIYALEDEAVEIDAGRLPTNPLKLVIVKRSESEAIIDRQRYKIGETRSYNNIKKSPLGGKAYLSTSRRRIEVPINKGRQVIVISAKNEYLLNNALALLRPTQK